MSARTGVNSNMELVEKADTLNKKTGLCFPRSKKLDWRVLKGSQRPFQRAFESNQIIAAELWGIEAIERHFTFVIGAKHTKKGKQKQ